MINAEELKNKTKDELLALINSYQEKCKNQTNTISQLLEQLKLARHKRFGSQSEKSDENTSQQCLFNEAVLPINQDEIEKADEEITIATHQRKASKKPGRKPLPAELPREAIIYDIADEEKICHCGCKLEHIDNDTSEQLEIIPAKVYVVKHVRKKYACRDCFDTIKTAPLKKQPIPRSIAAPGLLAHTLIAKYQDHLPLYRQEQMLTRIGIDIPRATLSLWVIKCATLFDPLVKLMEEIIQDYDVAWADETRVQVLKEPGRKAKTKSWMWAFGGGPPDKFCLVYRYDTSRGHEVPYGFLDGFKGYLHCDGYSAYDLLSIKTGVTQVGCWYHARRKFTDAEKISDKPGLATQAIKKIGVLASIEANIKEQQLDAAAAYHYRNEHAAPLIDEFKAWLDEHRPKTPPKSLIGKAMTYTSNQWPKLKNYLADGRLENNNNRMERAIKPFAVGRKNWMFSNSVQGAKSGAIIYSLIETCKAHDLEPYDWFKHVLEKLPECQTVAELEALLPFNIDKSFL